MRLVISRPARWGQQRQGNFYASPLSWLAADTKMTADTGGPLLHTDQSPVIGKPGVRSVQIKSTPVVGHAQRHGLSIESQHHANVLRPRVTDGIDQGFLADPHQLLLFLTFQRS